MIILSLCASLSERYFKVCWKKILKVTLNNIIKIIYDIYIDMNEQFCTDYQSPSQESLEMLTKHTLIIFQAYLVNMFVLIKHNAGFLIFTPFFASLIVQPGRTNTSVQVAEEKRRAQVIALVGQKVIYFMSQFKSAFGQTVIDFTGCWVMVQWFASK